VCAPDKTAYRISFFDELVEDIKIFDLDSMASSNEVGGIVLPPVSDILADGEICKATLAAMKPFADSRNCAEADGRLQRFGRLGAAVYGRRNADAA